MFPRIKEISGFLQRYDFSAKHAQRVFQQNRPTDVIGIASEFTLSTLACHWRGTAHKRIILISRTLESVAYGSSSMFFAFPRVKTAAMPDDPMEYIWPGIIAAQAIHAVAKLRIPDLLASGPKAVSALASESGAHAPTLERLLRVMTGFKDVRVYARWSLQKHSTF